MDAGNGPSWLTPLGFNLQICEDHHWKSGERLFKQRNVKYTDIKIISFPVYFGLGNNVSLKMFKVIIFFI